MVKGISRQVIVVHSPDPALFEQAIFIGTQMGFYMPLSPTERSSFCSLHKKSSPSLAQNHWLKFYLLQSRSSLRLHMFLLWHRLI